MSGQLLVALIVGLASPLASIIVVKLQRKKEAEAREVTVQQVYSKMRADIEANADYYKNELQQARSETHQVREQMHQERRDCAREIGVLTGRIDQLSMQLELARGRGGG